MRNLNPDRIELYNKGCPVCFTRDHVKLHAKFGNLFYYLCEEHKVIFMTGLLSAKGLEAELRGNKIQQFKRAFDNTVNAYGKNAHLNQAFIEPREFFRFLTSLVPDQESGCVLDINCHKGHTIFVAEEFGWESFGLHPVDIYKVIIAAKPHLKNNFGKGFFFKLSKKVKSESQDIVTYMHNVNNSPLINFELKEAYRILKLGGAMVMQFNAPIDKNYEQKEKWSELDPKKNFIYFQMPALEIMAKRAGFQHVQFLEKPFKHIPGNTTAVMWKR